MGLTHNALVTEQQTAVRRCDYINVVPVDCFVLVVFSKKLTDQMCKKLLILLKLVSGAKKINPDDRNEEKETSSVGKRTPWRFSLLFKKVSASVFILLLVVRG